MEFNLVDLSQHDTLVSYRLHTDDVISVLQNRNIKFKHICKCLTFNNYIEEVHSDVIGFIDQFDLPVSTYDINDFNIVLYDNMLEMKDPEVGFISNIYEQSYIYKLPKKYYDIISYNDVALYCSLVDTVKCNNNIIKNRLSGLVDVTGIDIITINKSNVYLLQNLGSAIPVQLLRMIDIVSKSDTHMIEVCL